MLSGFYERLAADHDGSRLLAGSRLRRRVVVVLHQALELSRLSQSGLARKLGVRKSAVNQVFRGDGNVRIETLAAYLHEMGFELDVQLVEAGEPRAAAVEGRSARPLSFNMAVAASAAPAAMTFLRVATRGISWHEHDSPEASPYTQALFEFASFASWAVSRSTAVTSTVTGGPHED
jgi:transcriptional regulator with XRE-family HTH domain